MKFPTHAVLSVTTGRLLGDLNGLYKVVSFLVGRPVYTHELAIYGRQAAKAILAVLPDLPTANDCTGMTGSNWKTDLYKWEIEFGSEIDLPEELRDCLADDKTPQETLKQIAPHAKIITIKL